MKRTIAVTWGLVLCGAAHGQTCEPGWGPAFPNAPGIDGEVRGIAFFDSGGGPEAYVAGHFTTFGTTVLNGIARWDGSGWAPVGTGLLPVGSNIGAYWIGSLDVGGGPALYVGGTFTSAGGLPAARVARWDGAHWTAVGAGFDDTVRMMTVYNDGRGPAIYATGLFKYSGTQLVNAIARWSGTEWVGVGGGLTNTAGQGGTGYSIGSYDLGDGPRLYAGGVFSHAGGIPASNLARWDGRAWTPMGSGVFGSNVLLTGMGVFDHGFGPQLHIGGRFSLTPTEPVAARVARWTGSQWVQLGAELSTNPTHYVNSIVTADGPGGPVLHVGGWFTGASWLGNVNYTARWVNGTWQTLGGGMDYFVRAMLAREEAGKAVVYAVGAFLLAGDAVASRVARWSDERWHSMEVHRGLNYAVRAACTFDDGAGPRVFVGGQFNAAGGRIVKRIAAWDGRTWQGLRGASGEPGVSGAVNALVPFAEPSGAALFVGGGFSSAGGMPATGIARWDHQGWSPVGETGTDGTIESMIVHADASGPALYVGGGLQSAGGVPCLLVARWDGLRWSSLNGGINAGTGSVVRALVSFDDGTGPALYAGGSFDPTGPFGVNVVRWDGSAWTGLRGLAYGTTITGLGVYDDGGGASLYARGTLNAYFAPQLLKLARWDGLVWAPVGFGLAGAPSGTVSLLLPRTDGWRRTLVVASESSAAGQIIEWDGEAWTAITTGLSASSSGLDISALALDPDGTLHVGGLFGKVGTVQSDNFAQWLECPACYADCDQDGAPTAADFGCFQSKFAAGDSRADCNHDTQLTVADFGCFQTKFVAGCR